MASQSDYYNTSATYAPVYEGQPNNNEADEQKEEHQPSASSSEDDESSSQVTPSDPPIPAVSRPPTKKKPEELFDENMYSLPNVEADDSSEVAIPSEKKNSKGCGKHLCNKPWLIGILIVLGIVSAGIFTAIYFTVSSKTEQGKYIINYRSKYDISYHEIY